MEIISRPIDLENVRTVIYHLPDGPSFSVAMEDVKELIEFGFGDICDTSDIDGVVHFYPKGNA